MDMDCFYVQVEQRKDPSLRGRPCAVVQYKNWRGGRYVVTAINGVALWWLLLTCMTRQ